LDEATYLSGTDRAGREAPRRIASLLPWVSESLAELALANRLIAVTDDATAPEGGFPWAERVGPSVAPDVGRLLDLAPDWVLLGAGQHAARRALQAADVPVWLADPRTVRASFNLLWDWMNAFEAPQMVARVRAVEWMCDWLERLAETRPAPARVIALVGADPWQAAAGGSYTHDLLRVCGGDALFGAVDSETVSIDADELVALQPDVILLADESVGGFSEAQAYTFAELPVPAADAGRIYRLDGTVLTWPGTRVARAFDVLPTLFDLGR
jgi:iron complex transport system substrate-binding protein